MKEAVDRIAQVDLIADPGTALYYSGLGMQVAGRICELVKGKPWVEIFQEKIADTDGTNGKCLAVLQFDMKARKRTRGGTWTRR